jgi:hypothetical protein
MEYLVYAVLVIVLLLVLLLVMHLVDRVSRIEKQARDLGDAVRQVAQPQAGVMGGLHGRALWDVLSGKQAASVPQDALAQIRERYAAVLERHIEALFNEGAMDARMGVQAEPRQTRMVGVLRGEVESWLPAAQVNTIYQCGVDASRGGSQQLLEVRERLQETVDYLFTKVQLPPAATLLSRLVPVPAGSLEASADAAQPVAATSSSPAASPVSATGPGASGSRTG